MASSLSRSGPEWNREVVGFKIGRSTAPRRAGVFYLGDRRPGALRAVPWIGPALPFASALVTIRVSAAHGLAALSKLAAVVENTSPDRITAAAGARTGVVNGDPENTGGREPITSVGVGSVPFMRPGEAVARIAAGPDEVARKYEHQLESDVAAALNLPLHELLSDYSTGSFSNLRMSWQDAEREYKRRRTWWHRKYRLPMWASILSMAFADGGPAEDDAGGHAGSTKTELAGAETASTRSPRNKRWPLACSLTRASSTLPPQPSNWRTSYEEKHQARAAGL